MAVAPATMTPKTRPTTMILSSPSVSHIPGSIFPDVPSQQSLPRTMHNGRPEFTRRHTTYMSPPVSPRREVRPLRSSPLAGPSLALGSDGLLSPGSSESGSSESSGSSEDRPRYRPSRISSTPDVPGMLAVFEAANSIPSGPLSSRSDTSISITTPASPISDNGLTIELPAEPQPSKLSKRLSWGAAKLGSLPSLTGKPKSILSRSSSKSSTTSTMSQKSDEAAPPVPSIPVWALPSHTGPRPPSSSSSHSPRPGNSQPHPTLAPNGYTHVRRPSTAPNPSTSTTPSTHRRSVLAGAAPSTSRDPELNWLTQAAPPKFSRLSLKAEGVVMPVSAKEMNRRSRASTISPISPTYAGNGKGKQRESSLPSPAFSSPSRTPSRSSLVSFSSARSSNSNLPAPPSPPFRSTSRSGSYSSIESTLSLTPPSTPALTMSPSPSVISEDEVDEFGVPNQGEYLELRSKGNATPVIEVRVNDMPVDTMGSPHALAREMAMAALEANSSTATITPSKEKPIVAETAPEKAKIKRGKGTLKRAWKRVVDSVRG
ncbi:hypothetical protein EIP91_006308 [Steccherinum ochraceum]|uniref:Uncharacterized protein n=1 Tax=Steccherinum ochraceum TaxID=92696 RepID=A0A4R0RRE5_9APHY|nr:hypothetical protein EIP91_006308 [Steccherinum ochraceum]